MVYLHMCMDFALGWDAQNHCSILQLVLILHAFNMICKHLFALCSGDLFNPLKPLVE